MPDHPSTTLDLSQPAQAMHLATAAFATELRERTRMADLPHFMLSIYWDSPSGPPTIRYILSNLGSGSVSRVQGSTPDEAIAEFTARSNEWQETRP